MEATRFFAFHYIFPPLALLRSSFAFRRSFAPSSLRCVVYELTHLAAVSLPGNVNQSFMLADSIETSCPCCCTVPCFGPAGFVSELIYYDPIIIVLPAPSKSLTLVSCFYKRFDHYEFTSAILHRINARPNRTRLSTAPFAKSQISEIDFTDYKSKNDSSYASSERRKIDSRIERNFSPNLTYATTGSSRFSTLSACIKVCRLNFVEWYGTVIL